MNDPTNGIEPWGIIKYLWMVVAGVFTWVFKTHVDDDKNRETEMRAEIRALHSKIDDNHREVMRVLTRD